MLKQIIKNLRLDKDYSERSHMIDIYTRVLNGELYDDLPYPFCEEQDACGDYIPLHRRQPSVNTGLCKTVVDGSVSLLFGNDHFPKITTKDDAITERLNDITEGIGLKKTMMEAALTGSVGSVALFMRIIEGKVDIEVMCTQYLTPEFDHLNPKKIIKLTEKYKVRGEELIELGYKVDSPRAIYWFKREWDDKEERYYLPYRGNDTPIIDNERTIKHNLGFVPVVWIKNLPKPSPKGRKEVDGACTFSQAINTVIEIDYLLSQGGRGLKYSSDPLVVFKLKDDQHFASNAVSVSGDMGTQRKMVKSSNAPFIIGTEDDAKMLEINGLAAKAIIEHVRYLRELAMESMHGNRSHADRVGIAQSGAAMEKLDQALIWLADILRVQYGDDGIIPILEMVIAAAKTTKIFIHDKILEPIESIQMGLTWPHWYPPSPEDKVQEANAIKSLTDSGNMSHKAAVTSLSNIYPIPDIEAELSEINKDQDELMKRENTQVNING